MKEIEQIEKVIDRLNKLGWNSSPMFGYEQEVAVSGSNNRIADIVLYRAGKPIGLIEVKQQGFDLLSNIKQPLSLSESLGASIIYHTDGEEIYQLFQHSNIAVKCHDFISVNVLEIVNKN
jgi:type I site-specific restriction endonuclease